MNACGRTTGRRRERGFTLLEVMVALAITAISVFPMLQILQECEKAAFDAKFVAVASDRARALLSYITVHARPGDSGEGDLTQMTEEEGYATWLAYENIGYRWEVQAFDLSIDSSAEETQDSMSLDARDTDPFADAGEDALIDDRFRARHVRVTIFYQLDSGDEREFTVETLIPAIPRETDGRIPDPVGRNPGV